MKKKIEPLERSCNNCEHLSATWEAFPGFPNYPCRRCDAKWVGDLITLIGHDKEQVVAETCEKFERRKQ